MTFKDIIREGAPFLGGLLGGPLGAAAGRIISKVLVGDKDASEEEVTNAFLNASPEDLAKLRSIDADYKIKIEELGVSGYKLEISDRKNAREREKSTHGLVPSILAMSLTVGFFGIFLVLIFFSVPTSRESLIDVMMGALGSAWISCITYYFGSSYGSRIKTNLLGKQQ